MEERVKAKTQEKLMLEEYIARVTEERGRLSAEIEEWPKIRQSGGDSQFLSGSEIQPGDQSSQK